MHTITQQRPWAQRAIELEATEGHYADYGAWREWFSKTENEQPNAGDILGGLDYLEDINLYCIFCECFTSESAPSGGER